MNTKAFRISLITALFAGGILGGWWTFPVAPPPTVAGSTANVPSAAAILDRKLADSPAEAISEAMQDGTLEQIDEAKIRSAFAAYYVAHPKEAVVVGRRFADPRCVEAWYRAACELMPCEAAWAALS